VFYVELSKALTFQYDKMIYLIDPTDENSRIAGERVTVYEYPDGRIAFRYGHRLLRYQVFDRLACVDQGAIVDNKRLGAVLRLALEKQDEQEAEGQRSRSKKMPRRRAQERALEELRAINPVLISPEDFVPSLKR
jgi:hypothetical protein